MSNPADAENARVAKLLMDRLLDRQARFGGRLATAGDLQVGDTFLTGAGGSGGDQSNKIETLRISKHISGSPTRHAVIYKAEGWVKSSWIEAGQGVLILPEES